MMMTGRLRHWRAVFYFVLAFGTPALAWFWRISAERTEAERNAYVAVWLVALAIFVVLAWSTRATSAHWRVQDVFTIAVLAFVAYFEARWPGKVPNITPDLFATVCGMVMLTSYLGELRRSRRAKPA